jgi:hypothetical protein
MSDRNEFFSLAKPARSCYPGIGMGVWVDARYMAGRRAAADVSSGGAARPQDGAVREHVGTAAAAAAAGSGRAGLLSAMTHGGETALHGAARNGHVDVVRLLLERGADPNSRGEVCPHHTGGAARAVFHMYYRLVLRHCMVPLSMDTRML